MLVECPAQGEWEQELSREDGGKMKKCLRFLRKTRKIRNFKNNKLKTKPETDKGRCGNIPYPELRDEAVKERGIEKERQNGVSFILSDIKVMISVV